MFSLLPEFSYLTDKGKVRENNEDSVLVDEELGLAAVADGMGGHSAGELASSMAVRMLKENIKSIARNEAANKTAEGHISPANILHFAATQANTSIYETSLRQSDKKGMGTTLSAVLLGADKASIVHIGDSRVYLFREGKLVQLTNDHSLVMEQVRKGLMTKEEAEMSTMQNILTRALGIHKTMKIDVGEVTVRAGDVLLLCSDGLFKVVKEPVIRSVLAASSSALLMCKMLVGHALQGGGPDNVTVAVVKFSAPTLLQKAAGYLRSALAGGA